MTGYQTPTAALLFAPAQLTGNLPKEILVENPALTVLVVGSTGSIGSLVVEEAIRQGHRVRALVRSAGRAKSLPSGAETMVGDLTDASTLKGAVEGIDAVVFTHGAHGGGKAAEDVDYGAVRNVLTALDGRPVRVALMTSIGVTFRAGSYNQSTQIHDWKRRGERLLRASGNRYTIVRPGWFDYNDANELNLVFLQGDTRHAGNSSDGVISRRQIAEVLVRSLTADSAAGKTLELVATKGPASTNFDELFGALASDVPGSLDAVKDPANMPLNQEPQAVRDDVTALTAR
ncbi:SDR family oxidoreductase [Arthrobacter sp. MDT1-65]